MFAEHSSESKNEDFSVVGTEFSDHYTERATISRDHYIKSFSKGKQGVFIGTKNSGHYRATTTVPGVHCTEVPL
jgi:hypothetical protein